MLHGGDNDFVSAPDVGASPRLGHEVDALGGSAHENNFPSISGVQETLHGRARFLVSCRSLFGKSVYAAMNIGIVRGVVVDQGIDDGLQLLCGGGVIEIDERLIVNFSRQDRKIGTNFMDIEIRLHGRLRPKSGICGRGHPTSSQRLATSPACAELPLAE